MNYFRLFTIFSIAFTLNACGTKKNATEPEAAKIIPVKQVISTTEVTWTDITTALSTSVASKKPIFIDFYTPWCGWCIEMDKTTFKDPDVIKFLNTNFICVKFNAEGSEAVKYLSNDYINTNPGVKFHAHQFAAAILGQQIGYPTFGVLKSNHQVGGKLVGYNKKDQLIISLTPYIE
jgi:thiol:disulfide interchange protein